MHNYIHVVQMNGSLAIIKVPIYVHLTDRSDHKVGD